ncbi:hypothetical protein F8568_020610 [Actinomadura sp. LD22]|uniref:Uncharacterized protein n=1 Tax=Actinomadura physcomitrii TaxID=2650748 RepID=A0A6I4MAE3_9ACTN|nr:hypothetical protein [Actinomadura physcomitrii]MWA02732.1 hypothetical protein [Actinomadura physcomitrii]
MKVVADIAADEFPLNPSNAETSVCQESIELADADLAELVRLPWRRSRTRLNLGPEPTLQCSHERDHAGEHVAFSAESGESGESGELTLWVAWDRERTRIFSAEFCSRSSASGHLCSLPRGHLGRHAMG